MKRKRICAFVAAFVVASGTLAYLPEIGPETFAETLSVEDDFEVNYDGWYETAGSVRLMAEAGIGYNGTRGMAVTQRSAATEGATSEKGLYLDGGVKYHYSVAASAKAADTFRLVLSYMNEETEEVSTVVLAEQDAAAGEWVTLETDYKAPKGSVNLNVTITSDSTQDFVFDDFNVRQLSFNPNTVSAATAELGLKDAFSQYFRVGNIFNWSTINDSTLKALAIKNYNSLEGENETKPDSTLDKNTSSNTNIGVSINSAAKIMEFCVQNGIGMRGHTMVWHSQTPQWFFKDNFEDGGSWVSSSVMDQRLESYIKNLFALIKQRYPELDLYAYDVCNECISDDSNRTANNGGARTPGYGNGASPWVQIYGSNVFIEKAFTYAKKYAPDGCALFYNDYNEYWDHKRDCIYKTCKALYDKNLLDGVGMQSHINADMSGFSGIDAYRKAMQLYSSIGCQVQATELDISVENGKFSAQQQAEKYKAVFQAAMDINDSGSGGKVTAMCIWGPNDGNSWLSAGSNALLYDSSNREKAAYTTLSAMVPKPWTPWEPGSDIGGGNTNNYEPDENGYYYHSTFEDGMDSWTGRGDASAAASTAMHYAGSKAALVTGRTSAWHGIARSLNTKMFKPGESYSFSANVSYDTGASTDTFFMKLQYTDASGTTIYDSIAEGTCIKGEWTQLANTKYTIPADATNLTIYIETEDSTVDFYADELIGAVSGTKITGAGQKIFNLGDVNMDGNIDASDLSLAKQGLRKGFASSMAKLAADVDDSGEVNQTDMELLRDFLLGKIDKFPKAERVVNTAEMEALFKNVKLATSYKMDGENNPLYTQRFGADPGFMVYKDRMYVYTTNDAFEYKNGALQENSYDVTTINCLSSEDLVNWTDHGAIPVAGRNGQNNGAAKWAWCSWAPDACWKTINGKDKFFLYFANSGGGIGVLTADSPTGPWTDPLGKALLTGGSPNCSDVVWMFDPGVLVDDDGTGYLYFGGGVDNRDKANPKTGRCVKLGADMISLAGAPVTMETPYLFEDSSIIKIGDTYYYSYCANWNVPNNTSINGQTFNSADICYMTSKNPLGPWTSAQFGGMVFRNTGSAGLDKGGNNHHSIVEFKGKYYVLYHTRVVENRMNIAQNYRSPSISEATITNGKITCTGSHKGITQLSPFDPYQKVQAETMSQQAGINVKGVGDTVVTDIQSGDWIKVKGADFSKGCARLTVKVSSTAGAAIKVTTGGPDGTAIGYVEVPAGTNNAEITVPVNSVTGTKDICFVFSGPMEFDYWSFE